MAPDPGLGRYRRFQLAGRACVLHSTERRVTVRDAIERTCVLRGWRCHALNVRTNHVHAVISAAEKPEAVMTSLKAWATKSLIGEGLAMRGERIWTRHGSTRYLWNEADIIAAGTYVLEGQGRDLD